MKPRMANQSINQKPRMWQNTKLEEFLEHGRNLAQLEIHIFFICTQQECFLYVPILTLLITLSTFLQVLDFKFVSIYKLFFTFSKTSNLYDFLNAIRIKFVFVKKTGMSSPPPSPHKTFINLPHKLFYPLKNLVWRFLRICILISSFSILRYIWNIYFIKLY